ncbi:NAD(P)-dependent oxidoreductase [Runella limosa]|uniref:NAD(P)-dependent oxidoreductase n=1 Tax=Runella limosa TaxID=370978 RepID=UPI000424F57E|nr:NAD(P)-dependent oxidoreductase [Runella limosa]
MLFDQITLIDSCRLTEEGIQEIATFSRQPLLRYYDVPTSDEETLARIGQSDCVLVSWQTPVSAQVIAAAPSLKYIGMCCSLYSEASANVDIGKARELGIKVLGVRDYGDEGVVEYIFAQLIQLFKGFDPHQWKPQPVELGGKTLGVIGLGTLGMMVAKTALHFGMTVYYFGRQPKPEAEQNGIHFLPLHELLATCDVVTTHLPKHTILLGEREFLVKKPNSILINTSLGPTFDVNAFTAWLQNDLTSFAILDSDGAGKHYEAFSAMKNVLLYPRSAGFTEESKVRLTQKVIANLRSYLG